MTELSDKLTQVRQLIARGWCQGAYERDKAGAPSQRSVEASVSYCLAGAIIHVSGGLEERSKLFRVLSEKISGYPADMGFNLTKYNDKEGRTAEEVLAVIDDVLLELG